MHRYLRAVGFSQYTRSEEAKNLLARFLQEPGGLRVVEDEKGDRLAWKRVYLGRRIGVDLCGLIDPDGAFEPEFYTPWFESNIISTMSSCRIQKHAARDEFSGIVQENRVGLSLIFYLQNPYRYSALRAAGKEVKVSSVMLGGLSVEGKVLLPSRPVTDENKPSIKDCDDLYSFVDTTFLPYGIESDQYTILAKITEVEQIRNRMTGEMIYLLTVECNEMEMQVCINERDLVGIPAVGRRFKGSIWMMGVCNYEDDFLS